MDRVVQPAGQGVDVRLVVQGRPDRGQDGADGDASVQANPHVGPYELVERLGSGGHGTVWRARSAGALRTDVAVKVLHNLPGSGDLVRLEREAAVLARLDHPHIVRVIDLVADGRRHAIVTELASGGSLADLDPQALSAREVVALLAPIASALHSTHQHGLVHGDIKPSNILLTSDGQPLLADFGVAGWLQSTAPDGLEATPEYLAPELAAGSPPSVRTDVFSLGAVAHRLLVGEPPTAASGWSSPLLDLPISDALARLVTRASSRDSAERVESAAVFGELLALTPEAQPLRFAGTDEAGGGDAGLMETAASGSMADQSGPGHSSTVGVIAAPPGANVNGDGDGDTRSFGPRPSTGRQIAQGTVPGPVVRVAVMAVVALLVLACVLIAIRVEG